MKPYKLPQMFFFVFLLIILLMAGGGAWFYFEQREFLKTNINDDLLTIAQSKVEQITTWRRDQISEGIELKENIYLIQDLTEWQETQNPEAATKIISYLHTIQTHYGYSDITFVSSKGQPLLSLSKELEPIDDEAIVTLNEAMEFNETRLTDLHIGAHDQSPHISVIVPMVRQGSGKQTQIGALILINEARDFLYPLIQTWPTQSQTAETLLVERDGDSVLFLNELRHQKDTAFNLRFNLTETDIPAVNAVLGHEGIFIGKDYRKVEVLSALMPIPDSPWFMVAKIDTTEALAVWRTNAALIAGTLLGIIGVFAGAAVVFWQREEKKHYFRLAALESARRESEASHLVTLMSVGDGVIVTDQFGFIQLINPIAEALTGWNLEEAQGKPLEQVFRIISEETQENVENPAVKVIREGLVVGLANHTLLVARDGSKRPIADSGAPIRNDKGEISGVVLVFRDQTDERESQRELHESEKKFRTYFDSTPTAITLSSPEGKYIMVNPAFCELVGYSQEELLKKDVANFTHPDDLRAYNTRFQTMLSGVKIAYKVEKRIVRKDGSAIWVEGNTNLIRDVHGKPLFFLSNLNNITERKLAEEKLRESEEKFRRYFEDATIGISLTETTGKLSTINNAFCDMLGYTFEELSAKGFADITHPDDLDESKESVRCLLAGEKSTDRMDKRYIKKDGSILWADVSTMLLRDSAGQPLHFITNVIDITDRRLFQKTLEEKEAYIKNVLDNLPVGVSVNSADPTVSFSYINDNFVKFYRTTKESLSKVDSFWDAVYEDPKFRVEIKRRVLDDCASGNPDLMHWEDIPITRKGHETTYITAQNIPIDKNKLMVSIVWDTTLRKIYQEELKQSEELLSKAQQVAHLGSWIWNIKTNTLVWSDEMYRIFGIEKASFSGELSQVISSVIHPDDRAKVEKANLLVIQEIKPIPLEYRVIWPDGSIHVIWAEAGELILDIDKNPEKLTGIAQDITEFKLAEDKIKASEARYRRLFESAKDGILILDYESGQVVDVNPFLYKLLGLKSEDILGKELWEIGLFKDIAGSKGSFMKLKKESYIRYEDLPLRNRSGKEINVEFVSNVYEVNSRKVIQCIIRDITVRKQAEKEIYKLYTELEQRVEERTKQLKDAQEQLIRQERLAVLGQLAGGVGHELRNPLGVISNAAYYLRMLLPKADPKTSEYISIIDTETHRGEKIITDLLDFSRVKSAEREIFNLSDLVNKTRINVKEPENVKVEMKFPDNLPEVFADPSQITLVIGNLLENAIQAMPEGGSLTLSGREKIIKRKHFVALEVQDTGSGITPENLARLFEPLFTTKQRGIGLGLATSKNLVEGNGGMMEVSSEPGKGSLFTVYLPAEKLKSDRSNE